MDRIHLVWRVLVNMLATFALKGEIRPDRFLLDSLQFAFQYRFQFR